MSSKVYVRVISNVVMHTSCRGLWVWVCRLARSGANGGIRSSRSPATIIIVAHHVKPIVHRVSLSLHFWYRRQPYSQLSYASSPTKHHVAHCSMEYKFSGIFSKRETNADGRPPEISRWGCIGTSSLQLIVLKILFSSHQALVPFPVASNYTNRFYKSSLSTNEMKRQTFFLHFDNVVP